VVGNLIESEGPSCSVGESCEIEDSVGNRFQGEVVGFRGSTVLSMPLDKPQGIRFGDRIAAWGAYPSLRVGPELLGRVIDAQGTPLDSLGEYRAARTMPIDGDVPLPLSRKPITEQISSGIRAIDGFMSCGRGQRVGIFGGSGVGKTTLVSMMTRGTSADLTVLALIGERGREVADFLKALGEEGRRRSVVVVSTSDQSPLMRIRAAHAATSVAEYFSGRGKNVLLIVDSLTRLAMAQREVGLAAGEPPTAKGYTPSVLGTLAHVIERAGNFSTGSITAFYTVLMEGDDQQDPLVDTARSLLDGHIVLDRNMALRNHFPAISVLDSLSRLMSSVSTKAQIEKAGALRSLLAAYTKAEDLIRIGAYKTGGDANLDKAIAVLPALNSFLQQRPQELPKMSDTVDRLLALPS
jgi:flagellum-specific ATP synthase